MFNFYSLSYNTQKNILNLILYYRWIYFYIDNMDFHLKNCLKQDYYHLLYTNLCSNLFKGRYTYSVIVMEKWVLLSQSQANI